MADVHDQIGPARFNRLAPAPDVSPEAIRGAFVPDRLTPDGERCPTCMAAIRERYCAICGEERPSAHPRSIIGFLRRVLARVLDADNRLYRSLYTLLLRPGGLTVEFLRGRRRPFLGPIQLFALVNVAFYLFASSPVGPNTFQTPLYLHVSSDNFYHRAMAQRWVNEQIGAAPDWSYERARAAADSLERARADSSAYTALPRSASYDALQAFRDYADQFDRQAQWLSKSLIFLFIPVIAGWFWLTFPTQRWGRRSGLVPEIVQATHVMGATLFIFMSILIPALTLQVGPLLFGGEPIGMTEGWFETWVNSLLVLYLTLSFRRVQEASWLGAVLRAAVVPVVFLEMVLGYRAVLFIVGFYTA